MKKIITSSSSFHISILFLLCVSGLIATTIFTSETGPRNILSGFTLLVLIILYGVIRKNFSRQKAIEKELKHVNENFDAQVLSRTEQLSDLSRHLLQISEQEKALLARELHDAMGSNLTAIRLDISMVGEKLKKLDLPLAEQLLRAKGVLQETVDLKRRIMENLRPSMLDNIGLATSIRDHAEQITAAAGLSFETDIREEFNDIDPVWAITLFRIVQESLNNATKHAQASHITIRLQRKETGLWLQILDDGIGISPEAIKKPKSYGLIGMRERVLLLGGTFAILPGVQNHGTAIEIFIPFSQA